MIGEVLSEYFKAGLKGFGFKIERRGRLTSAAIPSCFWEKTNDEVDCEEMFKLNIVINVLCSNLIESQRRIMAYC